MQSERVFNSIEHQVSQQNAALGGSVVSFILNDEFLRQLNIPSEVQQVLSSKPATKDQPTAQNCQPSNYADFLA